MYTPMLLSPKVCSDSQGKFCNASYTSEKTLLIIKKNSVHNCLICPVYEMYTVGKLYPAGAFWTW